MSHYLVSMFDADHPAIESWVPACTVREWAQIRRREDLLNPILCTDCLRAARGARRENWVRTAQIPNAATIRAAAGPYRSDGIGGLGEPATCKSCKRSIGHAEDCAVWG